MENKKLYPIIAIIIFVLLVAFIFSFFLKRQPLKKPAQPISINQPPTTRITQGSLRLVTADGQSRKSLGEEVVIEVLADSAGADIVGYDLIFAYLTDNLELIKATSSLEDFRLFKKQGVDHLIVTGTKTLSSKTKNPWQNQAILTLTFKAKTKGNFSLNLLSEKGKETTKFVDSASKIYHPKIAY